MGELGNSRAISSRSGTTRVELPKPTRGPRRGRRLGARSSVAGQVDRHGTLAPDHVSSRRRVDSFWREREGERDRGRERGSPVQLFKLPPRWITTRTSPSSLNRSNSGSRLAHTSTWSRRVLDRPTSRSSSRSNSPKLHPLLGPLPLTRYRHPRRHIMKRRDPRASGSDSKRRSRRSTLQRLDS